MGSVGGISFACELDEASRKSFTDALAEFQRKTQRSMRDTVRTSAIDVMKSLRNQTKKAKKLVPRKAFWLSSENPKYSHIGGGLRRAVIMRKFGKRGDSKYWIPVETSMRSRKKNGVVVSALKQDSKADLIRKAREKYGKILNRGFAKYSWGWIMWRMFNLPNNEKMDGRRAQMTLNHVEGYIRDEVNRLANGSLDKDAPYKYEIMVANKIRYIKKATKPGALETAIERARKSLLTRAEMLSGGGGVL